MKTLDLNAYGISEMNAAEMQSIEGGGVLKWLLKAAEIIGLYDMATEFCEGFAAGAQEGYAAQQER